MFIGFSELLLVALIVLFIFVLPGFLSSRRGFEGKIKLYVALLILIIIVLSLTKLVFSLVGVIIFMALLLFVFLLALIKKAVE